jgi:ectoine hydroxylase-related dioxygenase (phytanoyl-CoA dioxygenase family)
MIDFKKFDYEFDLNGFIVLKNLISRSKVKRLNDILQKIENSKPENLPHNVFFGKKKNSKEAYISNVIEIGKDFEDLAINPLILKIMNRITLGFYRLNHAVAMTKYAKGGYTYLHMGNLPMHPKVFYMVKNDKIFSNVTKVLFPLSSNTELDGGFAVIPGSHKCNFYRPFDNNPKNNLSVLKHVDASPGDAVVFTEALAHGSLINKTNRVRRILSYCYSVGYMPDWTKLKLTYSKEYLNRSRGKIKKLIKLNKG